jgi:voltage-gated potassium channel
LKVFAMILFNQIAAAVLLLSLTLCLQCVGVVMLIEWLKRVLARDVHKHGPVYSATLVVRSAVSIVILHGLVILL